MCIRDRSIIQGTCCPHYDSEADRRPIVHKLIEEDTISDCYASEDGAAIHFDNGEFKTGVSFYKDSKSYLIKKVNGKVVEDELSSIDIS